MFRLIVLFIVFFVSVEPAIAGAVSQIRAETVKDKKKSNVLCVPGQSEKCFICKSGNENYVNPGEYISYVHGEKIKVYECVKTGVVGVLDKDFKFVERKDGVSACTKPCEYKVSDYGIYEKYKLCINKGVLWHQYENSGIWFSEKPFCFDATIKKDEGKVDIIQEVLGLSADEKKKGNVLCVQGKSEKCFKCETLSGYIPEARVNPGEYVYYLESDKIKAVKCLHVKQEYWGEGAFEFEEKNVDKCSGECKKEIVKYENNRLCVDDSVNWSQYWPLRTGAKYDIWFSNAPLCFDTVVENKESKNKKNDAQKQKEQKKNIQTEEQKKNSENKNVTDNVEKNEEVDKNQQTQQKEEDIENAQKVKVGGVIVDKDGTLPGVNVYVKGNESIGTTTGFDGEFSFDVPVGATVVVSYVGYKIQEFTDLSEHMQINMEIETYGLDAVEIVADKICNTSDVPQEESKEDKEAKLAELRDNVEKMKEIENSFENRMLGGASIAAMGGGGMMLATALSEEKADDVAEQQMKAYLATFSCVYADGKRYVGGETAIELPGGNDLINLYSEYVALANDLKLRKNVLGLRAGIEAEAILDGATSGLYDDVSNGKMSGAFASLARALSEPNGADAEAWANQREETAEKKKTGATVVGVGVVGSGAANLIMNRDKTEKNQKDEDNNKKKK